MNLVETLRRRLFGRQMQPSASIEPAYVSGISAAVVTRGGYDLSEILKRLPFDDIVIWDNSKNQDFKVFGRYKAIEQAKSDIIFTIDDDCLVDARRIIADYEPGAVVCNMKRGHRNFYMPIGLALVGHGAIFDRSLVDFSPYLKRWPQDELFMRECDRVFTWLNRKRLKAIEIEIVDLERASTCDRMWKEDRHGSDLMEIRRRLEILR